MDYEIRHDEYKWDETENEYRHWIFFLSLDKKTEIINFLKEIRKKHKIDDDKIIKFAGSLKRSNTKNAQIVQNHLALFSHLLITKENGAKTHICHRNQKDIYEKKCEPFLTIDKVFGCKFVLFYIPDNHKFLDKSKMTYADRVETTFRIGFKGGVHLLFSKKNPINIVKFYFDGNEHHGRKVNINKITKGSFRDYCNFDENCDIDDRQLKERDTDSKIIMSFVDNIIGAWSAKLTNKDDSDNILFSLSELYDRIKSNKMMLNPNGRRYKSMSVSKLVIRNWEITFPDFFENKKQPSLF